MQHQLCTCGDKVIAHEHYRPGTDCGLCPCEQYTKTGGFWSQLVSLLRGWHL